MSDDISVGRLLVELLLAGPPAPESLQMASHPPPEVASNAQVAGGPTDPIEAVWAAVSGGMPYPKAPQQTHVQYENIRTEPAPFTKFSALADDAGPQVTSLLDILGESGVDLSPDRPSTAPSIESLIIKFASLWGLQKMMGDSSMVGPAGQMLSQFLDQREAAKIAPQMAEYNDQMALRDLAMKSAGPEAAAKNVATGKAWTADRADKRSDITQQNRYDALENERKYNMAIKAAEDARDVAYSKDKDRYTAAVSKDVIIRKAKDKPKAKLPTKLIAQYARSVLQREQNARVEREGGIKSPASDKKLMTADQFIDSSEIVNYLKDHPERGFDDINTHVKAAFPAQADAIMSATTKLYMDLRLSSAAFVGAGGSPDWRRLLQPPLKDEAR